MRQLTLGKRIGLGCGSLVIIALLLAAWTAWNLGDTERRLAVLVREYIPQSELLDRLDSDVTETLYNVRGYAFTSQNQYLETGRQGLDRAKVSLQNLTALGEGAGTLRVLKEAIPNLR